MNGSTPLIMADDEHRRVASGEGPVALQGDWFVRAAAGSGKTRALVDRIVRLIDTGTAIEEIVAITFTEAAAAELRERVRRRLAEPASDALGNERRTLAMRGLEGAAVGTIHSFALQIVREFGLVVGVAPGVQVADEAVGGLAFESALRRFLERLADRDGAAEVFSAARAKKLGLSRFAELVLAIEQRVHLVAYPGPDESTLGRGGSLAAAISPALWLELESAVGDLVALAPVATDTYRKGVAKLESWYGAVLRASGDIGAQWALLAEPTKGLSGLKATKEAATRYGIAAAALADEIGQAVADAWRAWAIEFAVGDLDRRSRAGLARFHDLLVLCDAIVAQPAVAAELRKRYRVILIDEFQDTDPLQLAIARRITSCTSSEGAAEVPTNLFVVGDGQQSIYRFRGASVEEYASAETSFPADRRLVLTQNFRSVPTVVEWVNRTATDLWREFDPDGVVQYVPMVAARADDPPVGPAVALLGGVVDVPAGELRVFEVGAVAATVARALDEGWSVADESAPGRWRPARPSDIAILIPSRTVLPALELALNDAGIPYRIDASSLVWTSPEALEVLTLVRALTDAADERAVAVALRSPGLGCSDEALYEWRLAGGGWSLDSRVVPDASMAAERRGRLETVESALCALGELRDRVRGWSAGEAVRAVVDFAAIDLGALGSLRPRDSVRRLRYVVSEADRFGRDGGGDLLAFCRWADRLSSDTARVSEPIVDEPDDPSVRVLTIHAAKGLEFPIVALAGMSTRGPGGGGAAMVLHDAVSDERSGLATRTSSRLAVRLAPSAASLGYDMLRAAEEGMLAAERLRLLYVGVTRARDHLVVSAFSPEFNRTGTMLPPLGYWIHSSGREAAEQLRDEGRRVEVGNGEAVSQASAEEFTLPQQLVIPERPVASGERPVAQAAALWPGSGKREVKASALGAIPEQHSPSGDLRGPWVFDSPASRQRALAIGSATHLALELLWREVPRRGPVATPSDESIVAAVQAACRGTSIEVQSVEPLVRAAVSHEVLGEARAASQRWTEVPVGLAGPSWIMRGVADLVFATPAGLVVVDYKTDRDISPALEHYRAQVGAYGWAISAAVGREVVRAVLLQLADSEAIAHEVDPAEAREVAYRGLDQ